MRLKSLPILILATVAGCGGGNSASSTVYRGSVADKPSIEVLPSADVEQQGWSKRMRFAYLLTQQSLDLKAPSSPRGSSATEIQVWSKSELEPWLERKNQMVEAARAELDLAADNSQRELIMAGAMVGLMYEDVARVLAKVPMPAELGKEPSIAKMYRDVVSFHAAPYIGHARRAYEACAKNAWPEEMRHWSRFCSGRAERLPSKASYKSETTTEVTVVADP
jgi:hypothetical protein